MRNLSFIFWTSCIPLRITLSTAGIVSAYFEFIPINAIIASYLGAWGVGFWFYLYRSCAKRCVDVQWVEYGNFGGVVWWQLHRPVHGTLLLTYCGVTYYSIFTGVRVYPVILLILSSDILYAILVAAVYYNQLFTIKVCPRVPSV